MSYDLMVFDPASAPRTRTAFLAWYDSQTEWPEAHNYDDPKVSTPALHDFFLDIIRDFPALNGPHASDDVDDPRLTDYSVGTTVIYAAFPWSLEQTAYERMFRAAQTHRISFFDVSAEDGDIWLPNAAGALERVPR